MGKLQEVKSALPEQEDSLTRFFEGCDQKFIKFVEGKV